MWRYYYLIRAQFPLHVLYPSETDCEIDLRLMFDWKAEVPAESNQRGRKTVCRDTTGREKERERESCFEAKGMAGEQRQTWTESWR